MVPSLFQERPQTNLALPKIMTANPITSAKKASTDHPIQAIIADRWSPYGFTDRAVLEPDLRSLFEAARWSASSYNEQPWSYIVATRVNPLEFDRMLACLVPDNRAWAKEAPVLVIGVANLRFTKNGKENKAAVHDLGLASATLAIEATARGISVHQMIGILPDVARDLYHIPEHSEAWTGMAIGYMANEDELPPGMKERDLTPRQRKPLSQFVFSGTWGKCLLSLAPTHE